MTEVLLKNQLFPTVKECLASNNIKVRREATTVISNILYSLKKPENVHSLFCLYPDLLTQLLKGLYTDNPMLQLRVLEAIEILFDYDEMEMETDQNNAGRFKRLIDTSGGFEGLEKAYKSSN